MKKIISLILIFLLAFNLVACTGKEVTTGDNDGKRNLRMGYVTMDLGNPYFVKMIDGMKEKANELGIELTIHDGQNQAEPQIKAIENLITKKVDAIIVSANDSAALNPIIEQAKNAGIKVIAANAPVEDPDAFVGSIEYEFGFMGGEIAGEYIRDNLDGKANVAILKFSKIAAALERMEGAKAGLLSIAPNAKIVAEQEAHTRELGLNAVETLLQSNPNLNAVIGINDDAVLGAYQAMMAAGKDGEDIVLVGFDAIEEALIKIKEGGIYRGTEDIAPFESGKMIIETAVKVIEDGPIEELIEFPMKKVTPENVDEFIK